MAFISFFANYGGYPLVNFNVAGNIHDFDVSMLKDAYSIVEVYEGIAKVEIYKTSDNTLWKTEFVNLK